MIESCDSVWGFVFGEIHPRKFLVAWYTYARRTSDHTCSVWLSRIARDTCFELDFLGNEESPSFPVLISRRVETEQISTAEAFGARNVPGMSRQVCFSAMYDACVARRVHISIVLGATWVQRCNWVISDQWAGFTENENAW